MPPKRAISPPPPPPKRAKSPPPPPKELHETLLDPTTELGFISDNSSYSFVLYGKRTTQDACITINEVSFTQFCMKITIEGPEKQVYDYTTAASKETISKFISTEEAIEKEVRLQTVLDNEFRKNNKRPIVPYVIHDCFLSSKEFMQLFVEGRAKTLSDNVRNIIKAIQDNLKGPSRRVHIFFMEYMDNTKYKTLAQRISEWDARWTSRTDYKKKAYHRMAAILACVAGLNIFPYDASEPNVMLDDTADDVRLIDLGNTFYFYNKEDSKEIVKLYLGYVKFVSPVNFPKDKLEKFFIGENDSKKTIADSTVDLLTIIPNELTVEDIHKNLMTLAFVDFLKNAMIMNELKPDESQVMATSYCKSRFAMESVYGVSFINFKTFLRHFTLNLEKTYPSLNTVKEFIIEIMNNSPRQPNPLGGCVISGGGGGIKPTFIKRYLPDTLSIRDKSRQRKELTKSRRLYKQGKYYTRKAMRSFKSKPSKHLDRARSLYHVDKIRPSRELSRKTGCSLKGLRQIVKKGEGAYYSSGSRPNQTSQSWGNARLASAITGGNASLVDFHILDKECDHRKPAFRLAQKPRK
jgi:hypothetical protein